MKVQIQIQENISQPYLVLYTSQMTPQLQLLVHSLEEQTLVFTVWEEDRLLVLAPDDIYMVRIEDAQSAVYTKSHRYVSKKRLYEILDQLGPSFMQISKSTLIHLHHMESVEPSFNGSMLLKMKNGSKDYISRKYLPDFKRYLGL